MSSIGRVLQQASRLHSKGTVNYSGRSSLDAPNQDRQKSVSTVLGLGVVTCASDHEVRWFDSGKLRILPLKAFLPQNVEMLNFVTTL